MKIQVVSKAIIVLLWASTLLVALSWLFWKEAPFDPEPITVVMSLISTGITALLTEFSSRLEEEEFSLPYALAYGYVNNFIEPLISQILKNLSVGSPKPKLYIYIPHKLAELERPNVDRILAEIRMRNFQDKVINLEFQEGRARDVLVIRKSEDEEIFFDFPNTLLSLNSLIDYKMESRKNRFDDPAREKMALQYISKFKEVLKKLLTGKDLMKYVYFLDKELDI